MLKDVPVTAVREVRVTDVQSGAARFDDRTTVTGPGGKAVAGTARVWAVDRRSLAPAEGPASWGALPHQGLAAGFPLHPEPHDYALWDAATATASTARYTGTETRAGHRAYVYEVSTTGPVADARTKAALPPALPTPLVAGLSQSLPQNDQDALKGVLASSPKAVPLSYQAQDTATAWVDTKTGVAIDQKLRQAVVAQVAGASGPVTIAPVLDLSLAMTPDSVKEAADRANTAATARTLIGTVTPLVLLALAAILGVLAALLGRRRDAVLKGGAQTRENAVQAPEPRDDGAGTDKTDDADGEAATPESEQPTTTESN
ncbi:porin PorA family protein [Peterkaempfera sp. SMS 1(5)a]|uniref:porin PorA family protein n=1 Tax=Peterkaempfera podocarpi TaxID=3232308 RepID=UPI00366AC479